MRVYKRKKHSVSAVLSCSGTQDVSVAALRLLLILYVRSHGTQESVIGQPLCDFSVSTSSHRSLRSLHPLPRQPPWKQAFSGCHCNVWPLWGMPWGYINEKNTAFLLCFLVAGPRIELGTSWLWILSGDNSGKLLKSKSVEYQLFKFFLKFGKIAENVQIKEFVFPQCSLELK